MKNPALNNAGLQFGLKFFGSRFVLPELFSWLFYVAASRLNSPRFSSLVIRLAGSAVKFQYWDKNAEECLVFSVTMTFVFRLTESSEANKYNVFSNLQA